jgi:hypothetical protein
MTHADIIRMAREAGCEIRNGHAYMPRSLDQMLRRLVTIVAATERKQNLDLVQIIVEAEREACAKVVEQAGVDGYGTLAAAAMIRARGEK